MLPPSLKKGDTIGVIAPASPIKTDDFEKAICFFQDLGLQVQLGKHLYEEYGYLAGTDEQRLEDFHDMITNPDIKGIIFARGGYGTARIAPAIDYSLIKKNPKIIWGYSDITFLHTAIRQRTGLVTFHGPMVVSDINKEAFDSLSASGFSQLFQPTRLVYSENISPLKVISYGTSGESAKGQLVGGNLSLIASTLGTPFEIDTKGKILFIEDIGEQPYQVDRMLQQLTQAGKIAEASGIVVGDFAESEPKSTPSFTMEEVFQQYFGKLSIPVLSGFKIGHCFPHFAIPLGTEAILSAKEKTLTVEPGVAQPSSAS